MMNWKEEKKNLSNQLSDIMRPSSLDELIGNEHIKAVLRGQFIENNVSHTFLITGKYGAGKTTIARIIANKLEAQVNEHDAGSLSDIETIRALVSDSYNTSIFADKKVYIIDEIHKLSKAAQTVFLKVAEEPPEGVYFIFCTSEPEGIIEPLVSRCVKLEVEPVGISGMRTAVQRVMSKLGIEVEDRQDWLKVVEQSEESLRVLYNHIERLYAAGIKQGEKTILSKDVFDSLIRGENVMDEETPLISVLLKKDIRGIIKAVDKERKDGKKAYETTLGLYRYLRRAMPEKKKELLVDLAFILYDKDRANSWEGLEWALFKNS
jgi:DNA polymerase-3 subunit gamma/tau